MLRRASLICAAVLAFVANGTGTPNTESPGQPLIVSGWVRMTTDLDGLATAITVSALRKRADIALVDSAFRLQHAKPQYLEFEGEAELAFEPKRLTLRAANGLAWEFVVTDRLPDDGLLKTDAVPMAVLGLARYWGNSLLDGASEVTASLFAGVCTASGFDGEGGCGSCTWGGPGVSTCGVSCGGGDECSASCAPGTHACCYCPDTCRCCPDDIGGAPAARPR
jgi:hypothetical protein